MAAVALSRSQSDNKQGQGTWTSINHADESKSAHRDTLFKRLKSLADEFRYR
jgi:hypothetical protein